MSLVLLLALLWAGPAGAQQAGVVRRGPIDQVVRVTGTVLPIDVFRLRSTIEGRAEKVWTTTGVWVNDDQTLGLLINREFAALRDAHETTDQAVMEDRWQTVYQPTRLRCPSACYVLKAFARSNAWVKPRTLLFEAAPHLRLSGWVSPEQAHLVHDGMALEYWALADPKRRFKAKISHYVRDIQAVKDVPGGSFNLDEELGPGHPFAPGTRWEGIILAARKENVLIVPTSALIRFGDEVFLPVRVSTGITTPDWTEVSAGTEEKRPFLDLSDAQLRQAQRHKMEAPAEAPPGEAPPQPAAEPPRPKHSGELREPDSNLGEDPYSE